MKTHTHGAAYLFYLNFFFCLTAYPEDGRSPQTQTQYVFTEETAQLNCNIQPGRARSLYSVEWERSGTRIADTTFSISVAVQNMSQNGTVYQCSVTVEGCSPSCDRRFALGDPITLVVGGKCILTNRFQLATSLVRQKANVHVVATKFHYGGWPSSVVVCILTFGSREELINQLTSSGEVLKFFLLCFFAYTLLLWRVHFNDRRISVTI